LDPLLGDLGEEGIGMGVFLGDSDSFLDTELLFDSLELFEEDAADPPLGDVGPNNGIKNPVLSPPLPNNLEMNPVPFSLDTAS
jgi:hypothetical protein